MGKQTVPEHQKTLQSAFDWVYFAYEEGIALLNAARGQIAKEPSLESLVQGTCYTISKSESSRFVWLDVDWYAPPPFDSCEAALFVGLSYWSEDRVGSHLVVGRAEIEPGESGLVNARSRSAHWLVDYAVNPRWAAGKYETTLRSDGLRTHVVGETMQADFAAGLRSLVSATIPVGWIDSQQKLSRTLGALLRFADSGGTDEALGAVCSEATAESSA